MINHFEIFDIRGGGNTTIFPETTETTTLEPPTTKIKVVASKERKYVILAERSILISLSIFSQMIITKNEYSELSIIHRNVLLTFEIFFFNIVIGWD
jgi:actin beta/gamma 1